MMMADDADDLRCDGASSPGSSSLSVSSLASLGRDAIPAAVGGGGSDIGGGGGGPEEAACNCAQQ